MVIAVAEFDELFALVERERMRQRWSMRHLSKIAGLNENYVSQLLRTRARPEPESLEKLAKALRLRPEVLLSLAGYVVIPSGVQERPQTADEEEALQLLKVLPGPKRETALRVLRDLAEPYLAGAATGRDQEETNAKVMADESGETELRYEDMRAETDEEIEAAWETMRGALLNLRKDRVAAFVSDFVRRAASASEWREVDMPPIEPPIPRNVVP